MHIYLQLVLAIVPSVIVFLTTALFLRKQGEKEMRRIQLEMNKKKATKQNFLPERLEAYQRCILLLERIHPNSLVMRIHNPGMPAKAFQSELIKAVREEFDHNVTQQLFVSISGWSMLKSSKDETVKIINVAGQKMTDTSMANDLASAIFEIVGEVGQLPSEIATEFLKKEFQELF